MSEATGRPSTLLISPWTPYPLVFGGAIRVYYLIKMLATFSDVTLVGFRSWEDHAESAHLEEVCHRVVLVEGKPEQSGRLRVRATLSRRSFQYHAHHTAAFQRRLDEVVAGETFDLTMVTLTQMASYRLPEDGSLRVLDLHNIEHELLLRRAAVERRLPKRAGLWIEGVKFKREELALCRAFDLVLTPSDRERAQLDAEGRMPPMATIPNTIDPERITFRPTVPSGAELLFVGATQVDANRDGLVWFVNEVLPLVERTVPDVTLKIVGGLPPPDVLALAERPNVTVTGYVPAVEPFMAEAAVYVVPLRSGGGTRLKILESLAYGIPTVSTTVGAEGLDLRDGEHLLLGDDPATFARCVVSLLEDRQLGDRIRRRGRDAVVAGYSWRAVGTRLAAAIDQARAARITPPPR